MSHDTSTEELRTWERPSVFYNHYVKYLLYSLLVLFTLWSLWRIRPTPARFIVGIEAGSRFLVQAYPPDFFTHNRQVLLWDGMTESVYMAIVATVTGVAVSLPVAFMAAENISPRPLYWANRGLITLSRSLDGLIVAIIFVKAFGFGAFAGVLTLTFKSIGFFSKLLSEDIEDIDMGQIEAIRSTGTGTIQILLYGVVPQIKPRFIGLSLYRWDINLRAAAILGIVGAGGIGNTLLTSFDSFDYRFTSAILLSIIAVVLAAEGISAQIRRRVQ